MIAGSGCTLKEPFWPPKSIETQLQTSKDEQPSLSKQSYTICNDCILLKTGQSAIHAAPQDVKGMIEKILVLDDKVQFQGWAANLELKGPVETILIFSNDHLVYKGTALQERLDIAKSLQDAAFLRSGFSVVLDKNLFMTENGKDTSISIFAIAKNDRAIKLPFKSQ